MKCCEHDTSFLYKRKNNYEQITFAKKVIKLITAVINSVLRPLYGRNLLMFLINYSVCPW